LRRQSEERRFKKWIEEDCGLAYGFDYNALFQAATDSPDE